MKTRLLIVGKTNVPWVKEGESLYLSRIIHYIPFETLVISDVKNQGALTPDQLRELESEAILKRISSRDEVILLDEKGKHYTSAEFSLLIGKKQNRGDRALTFVVGGAFGFGEAVYRRADGLIALSKMTFPHQLVRVIFLEQLYRALTILKGEKYHH